MIKWYVLEHGGFPDRGRRGWQLFPVEPEKNCVEISKTAEKVAVRVRPSFDKKEKHVGLEKIIYCLSPDIHAFYFCSNLGRTRTNKTTFSAVL